MLENSIAGDARHGGTQLLFNFNVPKILRREKIAKSALKQYPRT